MADFFPLPVGIRDYTTAHVKRIEFISNVILDESELWGYKKILTPIFEKLDSLEVGSKQDSFYLLITKKILTTTQLGFKSL